MTVKLIIGFLISTLLLVVFEYILLEELYSTKRLLIVAASLAGVVLASYFSFLFFTKYHKVVKDS